MTQRKYNMLLVACAVLGVAALLGALHDLGAMHQAAAAGGGVVVAMAVVTGYGTGYKNPAAIKAVEGKFAEGLPRTINSQISIANGDSIASVYFVGKVPSSALLSPGSNIYLPATAGLTSFGLGFTGAPAALMSAVNVSAGGIFPAMSAVSVANYIQPAWQLAGLSSDPGGMLDLFVTLGAAAGAAALVHCRIGFEKTA